MKQLLLTFLFISFYCVAQDDAKYLEGQVPEEDGKVVFERIYQSLSPQDDLYGTVQTWAEARFTGEKGRVVFMDKAKGDLAAVGEDYLVFSNTALALDRTRMSYRLLVHVTNSQVILRVNAIKYEYAVSYQSEPEKYTAEEWITDRVALSKGKLNRLNGKFRTGTIDYVESLFAEAELALSGPQPVKAATVVQVTAPVVQAPATVSAPATETNAVVAGESTLPGYKRIAPENIPGNIIKLLTQDWMLVTAGNDTEFNMMTAAWGGLGSMFHKSVAFCFIHPQRYTYPLMQKYDTYTLTFYTEAYRGALEYCGTHSGKDGDKVKESGLTPITTPAGSKAFSEAWMIIECRNLVSQPLGEASIANDDLKKEWAGKQIYHMFVGEIINVWIK